MRIRPPVLVASEKVGYDVRIAVIGGTGLVGGHVVSSVERSGHEAVVVARSRGVDLATGEGLDGALAGAEAVIDVSNAPAPEDLGTMTERLLAAEDRAGVAHHVLLSIVDVQRVGGNPHYAGKRRQEELVQAGPVPWTIVHATQFHEFAVQIVGWTLRDGTATVPPLLLQPVAAADVGDALAEVAAGEPRHGTLELAGPETRTWWTWFGAPWPRAARRCGSSPAGATAPSRPRWPARSCCRGRARGWPARPSTSGSRGASSA